MALQASITTLGGVPVSNAYVRISDVTGFKNYADRNYYISIGVKIFKNATEAAKTDPVALATPDFDREKSTLSLTSPDNILVQAYNYLKSLSKYSGAIDV